MTDEKQNDMPDEITVYQLPFDGGHILQFAPPISSINYQSKKYHRTLSDEEFEGLKKPYDEKDLCIEEVAFLDGWKCGLDMLREKGMI